MTLGELIERLQKFDKNIDLSKLEGELDIYHYKNSKVVQCVYFANQRIYGGSSPFDETPRMFLLSNPKLSDVCEGIIDVLCHT